MTVFCPSDVERFRGIVARRLGLFFDHSKTSFLAEVLDGRLEMTGLSGPMYLSRIDDPVRWAEEAGALAERLTVTETYFFRNLEQFQALRDFVRGDLGGYSADRPALRILSAGCASGEEAHSLAIVLREQLDDARLAQVQVHGVDANPAMLEKARAARYSAWSLRETPLDTRQRWFQPDGREFVLDDQIRGVATFEARNLVDENPSLWQPEAYHAIFCRNVIMYFTPEQARTLVARMARALVPGGILFLGHAETLRGLSQDFHLRHTHGTFYYQRDEVLRAVRSNAKEPNRAGEWNSVEAPIAAVLDADSWVEAIGQATERVRTLTDAPPARRVQRELKERVPCVGAGRNMGEALQLLQRERYGEALRIVQGFPVELAEDADVALLRAVLLVHSARLDEATAACQVMLAADEMNAGAHYLLALCFENTGDRRRAIEHDQITLHLDPGFAMARLHLGLLTHRSGEREAASREFREAMALLQREEPSRLLLFGGGFGREALVALCRAELAACGGDG